MRTITVDEAEDILPVAEQEMSQHRWYTKVLVVFERPDGLWGFYYLRPATEDQEGQDRYEGDPVPVFPVVGEQVTTTSYKPAEATL